ncbi:MAG: hypothetical protein SFU25_03805 [Candidatus Caenarcaniphilales bacterium]|nr:hypothetical protein [Candidatus Caenarcaniphilales bacterium]
MFNAYTDALNSTLTFNEALAAQQENLLNFNTFGYKSKRTHVAPSDFGVVLSHEQRLLDPAFSVFMKGEKITKMAIDREFDGVFFLVKDKDKEYLSRLGDFKYHRQQRAENTYIGQPLEERTYLTTQDNYTVMGYAIGRGPVTQAERFKDPLIEPSINPNLGQSPIKTPEKPIGLNEPLQKGPLIPIDLTRGANGLVLDRYEDLRVKGRNIEGLRKGLWVPLYEVALFSVPNQEGLAFKDNSPYATETEESGLRQAAPAEVKIRPEQVEKSNVNVRYDSYHYKNLRNSLNL